MKKCPYCAEEIQDEAIKCRYCMEFLGKARPPAPPSLPGSQKETEPWYFRPTFLVLMFLTFPPFVLPSVWLHPRLQLVWKLVITAAVAGACWITWISIRSFMLRMEEMTRMLNDIGI